MANIGYLEVTFFGEPEIAAPAFEAALRLLAGSDARHLNDIRDRAQNRTREYWTNPAAGTRFGGPVHGLTSSETFRGEEFAQDMQTQKRAKLTAK